MTFLTLSAPAAATAWEQNPDYQGSGSYAERPLAVIDTGIDFNHPLLKENIAINRHEIPHNQIDDDGNGLIDDVVGWDFGQNDNNPFDYLLDPRRLKIGQEGKFWRLAEAMGNNFLDMIDPRSNGHGTHVAGIIVQNFPTASLLPIRLDFKKGSPAPQILASVEYAIGRNAAVVNMSLGGDMDYGNKKIKQLRKKTIALMAAAKDTLFVISAGNNGRNLEGKNVFPGGVDLPNILTVGAIDQENQRANFSNWGQNIVDIYAPGVHIESAWPGQGRKKLSGTSMAAPKVAAHAYRLHLQRPDLTGHQLKSELLKAANPLTLKFTTKTQEGPERTLHQSTLALQPN